MKNRGLPLVTVNSRYEPAVPVRTLQTHPENPRKGDLRLIAGSIRANGFWGAAICQESTRRVLVGNHRYLAAVAEGAETIPVIWVDLGDDEARRLMLADNRTNDLARNDDGALVALLLRMRANHGLAGSGYDEEDLTELVRRTAPPEFPEYDEDVADEVEMVECPGCGHRFPA